MQKLAAETPAVVYAFDLLALDDEVLLDRPLAERERLGGLLGGPLLATPTTTDPDEASKWLWRPRVIAKELDGAYLPGQRKGMSKIKHVTAVDCVSAAAGHRGKREGTVGSLILGLYRPDGVCRRSATRRASRRRRRRSSSTPPRPTRPASGAPPTRAAGPATASSSGAACGSVVEKIAYDTKSPGRIRHGTRILRWRTEQAPRECTTIDQLT